MTKQLNFSHSSIFTDLMVENCTNSICISCQFVYIIWQSMTDVAGTHWTRLLNVVTDLPTRPHGLTVRLTVWDANSRSRYNYSRYNKVYSKTNNLSLFLFDAYFLSLQVWDPHLPVFWGGFFSKPPDLHVMGVGRSVVSCNLWQVHVGQRDMRTRLCPKDGREGKLKTCSKWITLPRLQWFQI